MPFSHAPASASLLLCQSWQQGRHIDELAADCRPRDRIEAYAVQAEWPAHLGQAVAGWKIAATSTAGQKHIGVTGPIAGPVFEHRVHQDRARISLESNRMRVAECEIVFRFGRRLEPVARGHSRQQVLDAVASVHPGIEVPDSRFVHFERVGEAQLIADCACTNDMVVGAAASAAADRLQSLPSLQVRAHVSDGRELTGSGANVLGDPVEALVWIVNELTSQGRVLEAGHFVTTGACVAPIPVQPGDAVAADFGWIGTIRAEFN